MKTYQFATSRFDNLRTYSPTAVVAEFQARDSRMPNVQSAREYKPASEEYKMICGYTGEVLITSVDAKAKNNFHNKSFMEIQFRDPVDMKSFVEYMKLNVSDPQSLLDEQKDVITKWSFDPALKYLFVQTSRIKPTLTVPQLDAELKHINGAIAAIEEVLTDEFAQTPVTAPVVTTP